VRLDHLLSREKMGDGRTSFKLRSSVSFGIRKKRKRRNQGLNEKASEEEAEKKAEERKIFRV